MYITLNKKELIDAVITVSRFSERRSSTLPVLSCIIISAEKEGIRFQATNLETGIDLSVEGSVKKTGTVALPTTIFKEIMSSFTGGGVISLEQVQETVLLSGDGVKSTIKTLSAEDFPIIPSPQEIKTKISLTGNIFRSLISLVAGYASPSTVRPELASVLIKAQGGVITAVATDSFRLAEKKVTIIGTVPQFSILIPAKNALSITETLPDEEINIHADDHQCAFVWKGGRISTRLVAAEYPDYAQIIPKSFINNATVLKKDLEAALKRTAVFSDSFQKIKLGFSTKQKQILLSSRNNDVGETAEGIPAAVDGDDIELSFNHRYLQAPLSSIQNESITLSSSGIGRPLVMRGVGDSSFLYLVMPMNQ
jgi:DNA polymerase-3 subunit beta